MSPVNKRSRRPTPQTRDRCRIRGRIPKRIYKGPRLGLVRDKTQRRAVVGQVVPDTPAMAAGLKVGDIIYRVDEQVIGDFGDLADVLMKHKPGEKVRIVILREGRAKVVWVTLAEPKS